MHLRPVPALAAGVLAVALMAPVASATDGEPPAPALPPTASETAEERADEALAQAEAIATGEAPTAVEGDATLVLNQLLRVRDDLSRSERQRADALLARPTRPGGDGYADYTVTEATPYCGDVICIHYVATTADKPVMTDSDANDVPDSVEQALATAEQVHDTYVAAGYDRPLGDGTRGPGEDKVDVYLADFADGLYGYCTADSGETGRQVPAYCGIDNDFAEFDRHTPLQNQQVTLAHEYFHAVQFAYDAYEDEWFMEATATWAEDEVFDSVNDNRQFLGRGQLRRPGIPLDLFGQSFATSGNYYGNWIFFRFLGDTLAEPTETMPPVVRHMWRLASADGPDLYSTAAVQRALAARGTSLRQQYGAFASANRHPADIYEEGAAYRPSPVADAFRLGPARKSADKSLRLDHLTHRTYRLVPDGTRRLDWRLRIGVDMPADDTSPVARLLLYRTDGTVTDTPVRLSPNGAGQLTVGFSERRVQRAELVLVNASRRMRCWWNTYYACQGRPRDNNAETVFTARAFRA